MFSSYIKLVSLTCLVAKLLHELLLALLQHVQAVHDLQVNWRQLDIVPNDSLCPKKLGLKKTKSRSCLEAELLPNVLLDLLQPVEAVLDPQINLRQLKLVPNDSQKPNLA